MEGLRAGVGVVHSPGAGGEQCFLPAEPAATTPAAAASHLHWGWDLGL